jgi:hypothetical protein
MKIGLPGKPVTLHRYDLSFPPRASDDLAAAEPEHLRQIKLHLRGFLVTALTTLQSHRCAPPLSRLSMSPDFAPRARWS